MPNILTEEFAEKKKPIILICGNNLLIKELVPRYIQDLKIKKTILLTGNDLSPIFPISDEDSIKGINHTIFGHLNKNGIYYLFYQHPRTIIASIHILQKLQPEIEIKFENKKETSISLS